MTETSDISSVMSLPSIIRPPFEPSLIHPQTLASVGDDLNLDALRSASLSSGPDKVTSQYPYLSHKEYHISPGPQNVILSVFSPQTTASVKKPVIYYIHGGGQVSGDRFMGVTNAAFYAQDIDGVIVSVEYRLAPEHQAPAALHDCYDGLVWVTDHADELGIDKEKILIFGVSAGGSLAAALVLVARDQHYPKVRAQLLGCPMLDDRDHTVSAKQFKYGVIWSGNANRQAWDYIVGRDKRGGPDVSELQAPARATDLSGLPPTFLDTGDCDVFRDEIVAFASLLWKHGVSTELHVWPGAYHGFTVFNPNAVLTIRHENTRRAWVRGLFSNDSL